MSTELAVLYGASTIFALFVVFSTIINWVRYRDSRYSPVSVSGNSAALDGVDAEETNGSYSRYRDSINHGDFSVSETPQEIVGGPYKLNDSNNPTEPSSATDESPQLQLPTEELEDNPNTDVEDTSLEESDAAQMDLLDEECIEDSIAVHSTEAGETDVPQKYEEAAQDNTVHFTRESKDPIANAAHTDAAHTDSDDELVFDLKPTLLKFCLITHDTEETITGARIQMIMTKNGFRLHDGVFKRVVSDDGSAILSVLPARKPYRFDPITMSTYRSNKMLLGMTIYPNAHSLNHFKSLLTLTNVLHKDFSAYLCDENGETMNKEKLVNYIDILRSSFTTASETTEVQAAAMM